MPDLRRSLADPAGKRELNRELFDHIAGRYGFATRALSFGRDAAWKRELVRRLPDDEPGLCVDLATGTGDIAVLLGDRYPAARVLGIDLSDNMLARARGRLPDARFELVKSDLGELPLDDGCADLVTGGYALRNAPDLGRALAETHRVLKPGGVAFFLDFVQPPPGLRRMIHHALLHAWGGILGLALHLKPWIYRYIPESLAGYPDETALRELLSASGFKIAAQKRHWFGMVERIELERRR